MRRLRVLAVMASAVAIVAACGPNGDGTGTPEPNLPTMSAPTAPPTTPTDTVPKGVLAGRVTGLLDGCVELTVDDGTVWSLSGNPGEGVRTGSTVVAKVVNLDEGEKACGTGRPARLVSLRVVE
jgi:hypothetical protein